MSQGDWERFEGLVRSLSAHPDAPTVARANGLALSRLMDATAHARPDPGPLAWMDWERQKTLRLLRVRSAV
jgi:hypothetical protein